RLEPVDPGAAHEVEHQEELEADEEEQVGGDHEHLDNRRGDVVVHDEADAGRDDSHHQPDRRQRDEDARDQTAHLPRPAVEGRVDLRVELTVQLVAVLRLARAVRFKSHGCAPFPSLTTPYWPPRRFSGEMMLSILPSRSDMKTMGILTLWFCSEMS